MAKKRILAVALLALLLPILAAAQAISGDLVGTVTDKSGAAVAGATVVATNVGTNVKSTTTTNGSGEYRFTNLPVGTYNLTSTAKGFSTVTVRGLNIELNKTGTANISMEVGGVSTTVEVSESAAPAIDTSTAQIQSTYDELQLRDSPTATTGAGVLNLSMLQAGVGSAGSMGAGTGPSVGGQRPRNNNFTIEGVDNNNKGVTGPLVYIPNDAVAEFSVLTNQFSPEFGHSSGGQFNTVIVSGTNSFHGRAYEYMENRDLNAQNQLNVSQGIKSNPRYDNNRFGGQVGGPIFKNKLFFFANYEYNPVGQASIAAPLLAPTAGGYTTLAGLAGLNQNTVSGMKQYAVAPAACTAAQIGDGTCPAGGTTTVAGSAIQLGVVPVSAPNYFNTTALTTSMDYDMTDKDQIRGRYVYNRATQIDNAASLPVFYTSLIQPYHLVTLAEYHTFNSNITNEFRVGFNRWGYNYTVPDLKFPGQDAFPNMTIDELGLNLGPDPNAPQYSVQNTYSGVDNLSWVKGSHSLKFGFEFRKYISPQLFIQRSRGDYEWNDLNGYLTDAAPYFGERSFGAVGYSGDQKAIYWYANDTWKVKSNLSLNLGVRYEYTGVPYGWTQMSLNSIASVPGLITFAAPQAPKHNFMPRVGFAWTPKNDSNWSVRGGFGMAYDVLYDNIGVLSRPPQIGSTADCNSTDPSGCPAATVAGGGYLANGGIPPQASSGITILDAATARASTSSYLPINVRYPYSENWNLGIQHVFAQNYTVEIRYVGTRGVDLNDQIQINKRSLVSPSAYLPTYYANPGQPALDALTNTLTSLKAPGAVVPAFAAAGFTSTITAYEPWGASSYNGLQTQLNRRFSNGLEFQAAWTWSHTIDNSTADFFSTVLTPRRAQDGLNLSADRSNSALDHSHRLTLNAVYELPFFKNSSSWAMKNLVGNWQVAPTYIFETGEWATVQAGLDTNLNGDGSAGDRAIYNGAGLSGKGSNVMALKNTAGATVAYLALVPGTTTNQPCGTAAACGQYIVAQSGALSTAGRNSLEMRPINNIDFAVKKRINFTERLALEGGAQAFNLFNHPQFVANTLDNVNNGINLTTSATKNYLVPKASTFNNAPAVFSNNPRIVQVYMKFTF